MELWLRSFRYSYQRLRRSPGFSATVILTLALGIGANTAIFSVVYGVLLKPLGYPQPQQLVVIRENIVPTDANLPVNANHLVFWQQNAHSFDGISAVRTESLPLGGAQPEEIEIAETTGNLFSVLGIQPRLGRAFLSGEERPGHNHAAILTDALWRRRYNADPQIVGKSISLDGKAYRVAGVLPANFSLPNARLIQAFIPLGWTADVLEEIEGDHNYFSIARLKQSANLAQAAAELNALQREISRRMPDKVPFTATLTPLQEYLTGASRRSLLLLLVAVGVVLLIACVNIANLLLIRAAGSAQEAAVRIALGGTRRALFWSALAEPILLCLAGGVAGTVVAWVAVPLLTRYAPSDLPLLGNVSLSWVALGFAAAISVFLALACGVIPSWQYAKADPEPALRGNRRTATQSRSSKGLRDGLVVAEAAVSLALVLIAGLFVASMFKLLRVPRGFDAEHVLSAKVVLPDKQYWSPAARNAFYERALTQLRQMPGVRAAGVVSVLPLDGDYWSDLVSRIGDSRPLFKRPEAHYRWISPGYFESLMEPLVAGRFPNAADKGRRVAVISKRIADTVWPGENPIGQKFNRMNLEEQPFEVIGVVADVRSLNLSEQPPPMVYVPYWYRSRNAGFFVMRTRQDPEALAGVFRKVIAAIEPQAPVPSIRTMMTVVDGSVAGKRFETRLLLAFALVALLLASIGIYGVVAYSALQRTQEIGIRMAVGAQRSDVYRLILREGVLPVILGIVIGVAIAWGSARLFSGLLFQMKASDPLVTVAAGSILLATGILACLLPAHRAAKTEPLEALRYE
jgi:predicted permease